MSKKHRKKSSGKNKQHSQNKAPAKDLSRKKEEKNQEAEKAPVLAAIEENKVISAAEGEAAVAAIAEEKDLALPESPLKAPEDKPEKKKSKAAAILATVLVIIIAAAAVLFLTHRLVWLGKGIRLGNAESLKAVISADEVEKLSYFTKLKEADLTGSSCYKQIYEWGSAHPDVKISYDVQLDSAASFDPETGKLDLSSLGHDDAVLQAEEHARYIIGLKEAKLDLKGWSVSQLDEYQKVLPSVKLTGTLDAGTLSVDEFLRLNEQYPGIELKGTVDIAGSAVVIGSDRADIGAPSEEAFSKLEKVLPVLSTIKTVDFGTDEAGHEKLASVYEFQKKHPEITADYHFTIFGKKAGLHDEKLDLNHRKMTDRGEEVRSVIKYMPDLTFLDMDSCGVGNEDMASIRDDFPNIKVVWRIWFGGCYSVRTNVERILASAPETAGSLTPSNSKALMYCTDVKYLDVGHNEDLKTIDFVKYMPNLEVFICMWCDVHDISALRNCPHLEFFEVFTDWITDLSPLSEMKELKHLNICHNPYLKDLSPIYGLTQLERLWIGPHTGIPKSQIEHFKELAPNCRVNDYSWDAHDGWRGDEPRYQLLRKQMGYHYPEGPAEYSYYWNDPLYYPHDDVTD